jgi:hypothetical protein
MQLKYKLFSTIITFFFYENNQSTALRGPNIWSIQRKNSNAIDLEEMEQFPTNKIDGFKERIKQCYHTD